MLCPPALPRRLRHAASPDTLPTVRLADRETTARKPDLPSSLAWTPTGGLPPGPAACSLRARWDHQSQAFPDAGSREGEIAQGKRHECRFGWRVSFCAHVMKIGVPIRALVYFAEFVSSSALRRVFASFTASSFAQKCI